MRRNYINLSGFFILMLSSLTAFPQCDIPIGLESVSGINGNGLNEVTLSWGSATGAIEYSVAYRVSGSNDSFTIKKASSTSLVVVGLPASTTYEWKLRSVCATDWSIISNYSALDSFSTDTGAECSTPINLVSNSTGSGSSINEAELTWDAVGSAIYYSVAYRVQGAGSFSYKTSNTNSLTLSGLPANTDYEWKVRSICASDWSVISEFSVLDSFTSGTGIECTAPTGVNVGSATSTSVTIQWNTVAGAEQYYIQYRIPAEQSWANADYRFTYRTSDKTITGLMEGKEYEARMLTVCSTDGGGKWISYSDYSSVVTFNTFVCDTPGSLTSTPGATSAVLNWSEVTSALRYQIKYRESGTIPYLNEIYADAGETGALITNLAPNTSYDWIIRSRCSNDNSFSSDYSSVQTFTTLDGTACAIPTGLSASPSSNDATLSWNAVPGALQYLVKYRESGTTAYLNSMNVDAPATSTIITKLTSSTQYDWIIKTYCSGDGSNDSPYSTVQTFSTTVGPSCDTPTNLSSNPESTSALLSWDADPFAIQYRLKYRTQGNPAFDHTVIVTAPDNNTTITDLTPSTSYEWLVRTECSGENSAYTSIQTFNTTASMMMVNLSRVSNVRGSETTSQKNKNKELAEIDISEVKVLEFNVFPNPSHDIVYVNTNNDIELNIYNSVGILIRKLKIKSGENYSVNLHNKGAGMYYFRAFYNGKNHFKRIIIR